MLLVALRIDPHAANMPDAVCSLHRRPHRHCLFNLHAEADGRASRMGRQSSTRLGVSISANTITGRTPDNLAARTGTGREDGFSAASGANTRTRGSNTTLESMNEARAR